MLKLKCNQDEVIVKAAVKGNKSDGFATITTFDHFHTLHDTTVSLTMLTRENTIAMRDYLTTLLEETIEPIQQEIGEPLSDWKKLKLSFVNQISLLYPNRTIEVLDWDKNDSGSYRVEYSTGKGTDFINLRNGSI